MLYHALPVSAYFTNSKSEKDKDLLARLRAELQAQMYAAPPGSGQEFSPALMANGVAAKAAHQASGSPVSPTFASPTSPFAPSSPRYSPSLPHFNMAMNGSPRASANGPGTPRAPGRKPSPPREPSPDSPALDLVGTVALVWGVSPIVLEEDLNALRKGSLEKLYLGDLKAQLTLLARSVDPAARARCSIASSRLASLLTSFPALTQPGSPGTGFAQAAETPTQLFFTPPRKAAVFAHLVRRAADSGNTIRAAELLGHCQSVWDVQGRAERERVVDTLIRRWEGEPAAYTRQLVEAIADLADSVAGDAPSPVLENLRALLLAQLQPALHSIFPSTALPPPPPPAHLIPLLKSAPAVMLRHPVPARQLAEYADELRGAAVGEYVMAGAEMGIHNHVVGTQTGESGKDAVVEGFEKLASWIEGEITNVAKVWGSGLGRDLDPAAIILHKQLPLFLAEIQVLETASSAASDVFHLYEVTARLLALWDRLLPGKEHGFDLDGFFEPHVLAWLRDTEVSETYAWVARTVGMDQWAPDGEGRYSQSVTDLFEFIRSSTQLVRDLPLSDYKRAVFLIDLARTAGVAVGEYATSVHLLFQCDLADKDKAVGSGAANSSPTSPTAPLPMMPAALGGKASAWLAKGRHAVAKVEQRLAQPKADGFVVSPAALVKMTNMGAARAHLEDVGFFMEADACARTIREHKLPLENKQGQQHRFSVTVLRGQNLLTRGGKPADALVSVSSAATGERIFKSRTVLESEDPRWEQTFEVISQAGTVFQLELTAFDRQLVGKHDAIGSRAFRLDAALFADTPVRDVVLPLSPRGAVHLRIALDAARVYDVGYHLSAAARVLEYTAADMQLEIVDRMAEFLRQQLSRTTLSNMTRPLRDKKRGRTALTEVEIDDAIVPVYDYFDHNVSIPPYWVGFVLTSSQFSIFKDSLTDETRLSLMLAIWRRTVEILIALLVPALSERPDTRSPLSGAEVDVVFKWVQQLKAFFNAREDDGVEHGVPLQLLQEGVYNDMVMIGQYLDLPTPALRERAAAAVKAAGNTRPASPVSAFRALSLSPNGNAAPGSGSGSGSTAATRCRAGDDSERMAEVLLRILRMRPDTTEFLASQLDVLIRAKAERHGALLCN
jgi:hypothetical protein